jgi:hypothetical protein
LQEHHHAIPRDVVKARQEVKKLGNNAQRSLDGMFQKIQKSKEYSRENILHAVAKFVVCDDQVSDYRTLLQVDRAETSAVVTRALRWLTNPRLEIAWWQCGQALYQWTFPQPMICRLIFTTLSLISLADSRPECR